MASKAASAAKGGIRAWLMPEINQIKLELAEMRGDIKSIDTKIDEMDKRLTAKIDAVDEKLSAKIEGLDKRLSNKVDDLDKRLDIVQRLSVLEAKVAEGRK